MKRPISDAYARALLALTILAALAVGIVFPVNAAPRAEDRSECFAAADMLISARAMAASGIAEKKVREVLGRMYAADHAEKWADDLVRYAIRSDKSAKELTTEFLGQCMRNGGNVDGLLGVRM